MASRIGLYNMLFANSTAQSVNDSIQNFDWVPLGLVFKTALWAGMLLTCPIHAREVNLTHVNGWPVRKSEYNRVKNALLLLFKELEVFITWLY